MNRRQFSKKLLASVSSFALMDTLTAFNVLEAKVNPIIQHWSIQLEEYCKDFKKNTITPEEWQSRVEELYRQIELPEIIQFIDFQNLTKQFNYPDLGVNTERVFFPELSGLPKNTTYFKKIFGMQKDRAVIPHGHSNMASAHLILKGEMHLRHYDKIAEEDNHLIIKPTIDTITCPGESSSITDEKDNVHWFIANTDQAFTFDIILLDLNKKSYDIHNIDIYEKVDLKDGTYRVPVLDVKTALKKYGKHTHH